MEFRHILLTNSILTAIVLGNAFLLNKQFYPSVVYITKSKLSTAIIGFEAILLLSLYTKLLIKVFFDQLMAPELEKLAENIWPYFLKICLAFAIFERTANATNATFHFRLLCLFVRECFHLLAKLRIDLMERSVSLPHYFHLRIIGILLYLGVIDIYEMIASINQMNKTGLSIEVMFVFEYAILFVDTINTTADYILNCIQIIKQHFWEQKVVYSNYFELSANSIKLVMYIITIIVLSKMRYFPIFMFRSLLQSIRKFKSCLKKVVLSRLAIARMDAFPNATQQDLMRDNLCAVCRDRIKTIESAKRLVCKHIFHIKCLKRWFTRQQKCPTCRSDVINAVEQVHPNQNIENQIQENGRQQEREQNENRPENDEPD